MGDTEDTEDMATWVMLDTVVQSHMLTPLGPTSLMLSSMFPMVMLLLVSTALLTLELFTLPRDPLTLMLSTDTEDTDTLDLLPLDFPPCPMLASLFRDMLMDTDTDCGRCQDVGIYCLINTKFQKKKKKKKKKSPLRCSHCLTPTTVRIRI